MARIYLTRTDCGNVQKSSSMWILPYEPTLVIPERKSTYYLNEHSMMVVFVNYERAIPPN